MFDRVGHVYQARKLAQLGWLDHGFGTRWSEGWLASRPVATLRQIHSDLCRLVGSERGCLGEGDALCTSRREVWLVVRTADCVPVILADPEHQSIAVIHSGWRGTAANVVRRALEQMASRFGTNPYRIEAAIGPGISGCCYEVGPDVAERFREWLPEATPDHRPTKIDLSTAIWRQLVAGGVPVERIARGAPCTACSSDFHSWRRDGEAAGRMESGAAVV
jgi:YfiH family protein